jgi:hypothetical protein
MADDEKPNRRLSPARVAAKVRELHGNLGAVGRAFGVTRQAVAGFIGRRPKLQAVLAESRQTMTDNVESRFYSDCLKDDPSYQTSRIFYLKTQAKDRGYVEKQEIEHSGPGGGPLLSEVVVEHHAATAGGPATGEDGGEQTPSGVPPGADPGVEVGGPVHPGPGGHAVG